VHDLSCVHGILERLGEARCPPVGDAAWWDEGRCTALGLRLRHGARAHITHVNLPGVPEYRERLSVYCRDRVLELTFPSPYLRHLPTRLVERRRDGELGLRSTEHHVSYEEAFREELRAFHRSIVEGAAVVCDAEAGRDDVRTLIEAFRLACTRH
jgi:predicted dehydrogenase